MTKFYLDDKTMKESDQKKWSYLLDYAFGKADMVEFNILYTDTALKKILTDFADDLIDKGKRRNKIYASGHYVRFRLTDKIKDFIKSKEYRDWYNSNLEDISFLLENHEFFATITHEDYVIIQMTDKHREIFNKRGFSFLDIWEPVFNGHDKKDK